MDITRRLIGVSAIYSAEGQVVDVDMEALIRRLLLFDGYVLHSIRLQEFPVLARRLGYERLRDLLSTGLIEIRCECLQLTQTAQSGMFGNPILPNYKYQFHWIDMHDRTKYVHDCLQALHALPIPHKSVVRLKRSVAEAIRPLDKTLRSGLFLPFQQELTLNPRLLEKAIALAIRERLKREVPTFAIKIHRESETTFCAETDLAQRLGVDDTEAHKIIELGTLGVAHLIQTIGEMKAYSAVSGFREPELPLFRDKLDFIADSVSSRPKEESFQRVIDVAGITVFAGDAEIDVERLLKIRQSSEAREFREWLGTIGSATDKEIAERTSSLRSLIGLKVNSPTGQVIRFLALTAIGAIPQAMPTAIALSALDQFVLNRLLPRSGIAAFVNELYPSIFRDSKREGE